MTIHEDVGGNSPAITALNSNIHKNDQTRCPSSLGPYALRGTSLQSAASFSRCDSLCSIQAVVSTSGTRERDSSLEPHIQGSGLGRSLQLLLRGRRAGPRLGDGDAVIRSGRVQKRLHFLVRHCTV
jgi:hypothetical protein